VYFDQQEREWRIGEMQSLFRDVNERINATRRSRAVWVPVSEWVCECADETCSERIMMTPEEYEAVRADSLHFVVVPSQAHVYPEAERIVEEHERYWVVEKLREAAEVAEQNDVR
jgi:hypothetical protein